jgi:tetratricopeptide (TPR) repeat protein
MNAARTGSRAPWLAALALLAAASGAYGQREVPLRYDLRLAGPPLPAEIPAQPDPYKFGNYQPGNLSLTGNVRYGRSFQGHVPFSQTGNQLSTNLPSLHLSNFRRDSFGADDIGSSTPYGETVPYFPSSGRVTNITDVGRRFEPDERGLLRPDYLPAAPSAPAVPSPTGLGTEAETAAVLEALSTNALSPSAARLLREGLRVPQETRDYINALIERSRPGEGAPAAPDDGRQGAPASGPSATGYALSYEAPETATVLRPIPGLAPAAVEEAEPAPAPPAGGGLGLAGFAMTRPPVRARALPGSAVGEPGPPTEGDLGPPPVPTELPPAPVPHAAGKGSADYFQLAEQAMRQRRYDYAEGMYAAALALDRDRPEAVFGRVHATLGASRYVEVNYILARAFADHPEWAKSVPDPKAAYVDSDQLDRILANLAADIEHRPGSASLRFVMGYVLYASGRPAEARPYLVRAANMRGEDEKGPEAAVLQALDAREKK